MFSDKDELEPYLRDQDPSLIYISPEELPPPALHIFFGVLNRYRELISTLDLTPLAMAQRSSLVDFKVAHTVDVLYATRAIIRENGGFIQGTSKPYNLPQAYMIALLHDLGRFPEAEEKGTFNRTLTGFEHAKEGATLVSQYLTRFGLFVQQIYLDQLVERGCDFEVIFNAIWKHDAIDVDGPIDPYLATIKDADMLANLIRLKEKRIKIEEVHGYSHAETINAKIMGELEKGNLFSSDLIESEADHVIYVLVWLLNLQLESTKRLVLKNQIIDNLLQTLVDYHIDAAQIRKITSTFKQFWNSRTTTAPLLDDKS
jgi:hypothetical protein